MVLNGVQPPNSADHEFVLPDPQFSSECKIVSGIEPLGIHPIRYECQLVARDSDCLLQPGVKVFRNCDELSCAECQQPACEVSAVDQAVRIADVTAVLTVYQNGFRRETGGEHSIECRPVAGVDNVNIAAPEKFTKLQDNPHTVSA